MIEILTEQSNNIQFSLQMDGGSDYDVFFTIIGEGIDYRLKAHQSVDKMWSVSVPKSINLNVGQHDFRIDVVMDNHIYPAVQDELVVKAPIRASASIVETRSGSSVNTPKVRFIGAQPPAKRAR